MWTSLDWFDRVLLDATLATTILLSFVILTVLLCRQPGRRIVVVRAAAVLIVLIMPVLASNPLSRLEHRAGLAGADPQGALYARASTGPLNSHSRFVRGWGSWPGRALGLAYLACAGAGLGWTALGFWGTARLIRNSTPPSPRTLEFFHSLLPRSRTAICAPELRISTRISRPILVGLLRPRVLIPTAYEEPGFDPESLRIILLHELAHAANADHCASVLAGLSQCLWFFHPFVWWLRAQLRVDQEFLADECVVLATGSPAGYATRLVSLAAISAASAQAPSADAAPGWQASSSSRETFPSPLMQRVMMLLHRPFPLEPNAPRWWALSAHLGMIGVAVLSIGASLALLEPPPLFSQPARSRGDTGAFRVDQFIAPPWKRSTSDRSTPYILPLPLPTRFQMTAEIEASASAIALTRLAGLSLAPPSNGSEQVSTTAVEGAASALRHRIQITRSSDHIAITVDDSSWRIPASPDRVSSWLSIEPPRSETVILRNLEVIW